MGAIGVASGQPTGCRVSRGSRVYLVSLGCSKNLVDSEHMLGLLETGGYGLAGTLEEADTVVINTCGFIEDAAQEAVDAILEAAREKEAGRIKRLIVTGCLVQRYGYKLSRELPEVDGWLGTGEFHRLTEVLTRLETSPKVIFLIGRPTFQADHRFPRVQTTPFFTAYLKIAEGCSHRCTYCCIPRLRGALRSREADSLIREAERMAAQGVKELVLVGQDITAFGRDRGERGALENLLRRLVRIDTLQWVRLMYCNPEGISDQLLRLMEGEEKICPYLDIPFQHVSRELLLRMGRGSGGEPPAELIGRIRACSRRIALRTTLMVGFPGETEAHFEALRGFVKETRFDHLGVFAFSPESGTPAARIREGAVPAKVAAKRLRNLMRLQAGIAHRVNRAAVGTVVPVLIEGHSPETELLLTGRTATMAPEVDGQVLINKGTGEKGAILPVRMTEAHPYDLVGEIVECDEA